MSSFTRPNRVETRRSLVEPLEPRRLLSKTIFVDATAPAAGADGTTWSTAYPDLQQGLATATSGDQIFVADGTYRPTGTTNRSATFQLKSGVRLFGGYAGRGASNPDARDAVLFPTILSGDIGVIGTRTDNSYHVVTGSGTDSTAVLDAFIIRDGYGDGTASPNYLGAGMYNSAGSPTLSNCSFLSNTVSAFDCKGGGMYNAASSAPKLVNCTFNADSAEGVSNGGGYGGGIYNLNSSITLENCTFSGNHVNGSGASGGSGAGIFNDHSTVTLTGSTFTNNASGGNTLGLGSGGGIFSSVSTMTATACTFTGNSANRTFNTLGGVGGAAGNSSSTVIFDNCTFTSNLAGDRGGAIYDEFGTDTVRSCTFESNSATTSGGAIIGSLGGSLTVSKSLFHANSVIGSTTGGGAIYTLNASQGPQLINCTFDANTSKWHAGAVYFDGGTPTVTTCVFTNNTANDAGGAMYINASNGSIMNCSFTRNSAVANNGNGSGGALYNIRCTSGFKITSCSFNGNTAKRSGWGGAIFNSTSSAPVITNCTFVGNSSESGGGAVGNIGSSAPTLINCSITVNSGGLGGAVYSFNSSTATLTNCVVWGNISQDGLQISQATGTPAVRYSDIQGGYAGTSNLNSDPLFIRNPATGPDNKWGTADDDYGDLHVSPTSPLLDAGNNADIPAAVLTDLDANSRLVDIVGIHDPGTLVDIGAYEKSPPLVVVAAQFSTAAIRPTLTFTFNCAVQSASAIAADLILTDRATNRSFNAQGFADVTYDRASFSISWQFYALPSANYDASVAAMSISDMSSAGLSADFSTALYILSADGDRNRQVDIHDFNILATNFGKSGQTFEQGNYDYSADGKVTITDFNILATNFGKHLDPPAGPSPMSAPVQTMAIGEMNRTAPTQRWLNPLTDDTNLLSDIGLV